MTTARRLWILLALAAVLIALALDFWNRTEPIGIDFHTYEAAARVGLHDGWAHIYDQALVADEQRNLVPDQATQPFLSPPPVAWLAALLAPLRYWPAYYVWATFNFIALALALLWASRERGLWRWVTAAAVLAPWWVLHAIHLGQVVPLVAAGVVVAWRSARERHNLFGGGALALLLLKPNTAFVVPFALLVAGRYRIFLVLSAASALVGVLTFVTMGAPGTELYVRQVSGLLPPGANFLTLEGAFGVSGALAIGLRVAPIFACSVQLPGWCGRNGRPWPGVCRSRPAGSLRARSWRRPASPCTSTDGRWSRSRCWRRWSSKPGERGVSLERR